MFPSQFLSLIQMPVAPEQKIKRYLISMKNVPLSIPGSDSDTVRCSRTKDKLLLKFL